jgi:hypothetical protein
MRELAAEHRWPALPSKVGPDFAARTWRFERTPGQLYQLIAYGRTLRMAGDPSKGWLEHPGPSGRMGEGWIQAIKDLRGDQLVATGDPVPIWNAVYYVWSRSIAAAGPSRFKDVWDLYGQNCSVCHGDTAQGNGPLARTLNPMPFNFSDRKALAHLRRGPVQGHPRLRAAVHDRRSAPAVCPSVVGHALLAGRPHGRPALDAGGRRPEPQL